MRIERGAAGGLPSLPDPAGWSRPFREGGLAALVQSREQEALMDRVQATMAVVEGYAEHVMDAVAAAACPATTGCGRRCSGAARSRCARTAASAPARPRPEDAPVRGRQVFCDAVVADRDIETLNRVWDSPEALPTPAELAAMGLAGPTPARPRLAPPLIRHPALRGPVIGSCDPRHSFVV